VSKKDNEERACTTTLFSGEVHNVGKRGAQRWEERCTTLGREVHNVGKRGAQRWEYTNLE